MLKLLNYKNTKYAAKLLAQKRNSSLNESKAERFIVVSNENIILGICRISDNNFFEVWFESNDIQIFFYENFNLENSLK